MWVFYTKNLMQAKAQHYPARLRHSHLRPATPVQGATTISRAQLLYRMPIPPGVAESSTSFGRGKGGNVTSAGWQETLCDPMWHASSRSGVATLRTAIHLLLTSFSLSVLSPSPVIAPPMFHPFPTVLFFPSPLKFSKAVWECWRGPNAFSVRNLHQSWRGRVPRIGADSTGATGNFTPVLT